MSFGKVTKRGKFEKCNESFRECIAMNFVIMFVSSVRLETLACLANKESNKYHVEKEVGRKGGSR
jgi:hypothetical protein